MSSLSCSLSLGSPTVNHCCCCPFAPLSLTLPPLKPPRRTGIKRLFCNSDDDDDDYARTTPLRLPPISSICNLQAGFTNLADIGRPDTDPASAIPRSNEILAEAFVAEFRRKPIPSAVVFWAQARPRVQCDRCVLEGMLCVEKEGSSACQQCAHRRLRCSRVEDERRFRVMNLLQLSHGEYNDLRLSLGSSLRSPRTLEEVASEKVS